MEGNDPFAKLKHQKSSYWYVRTRYGQGWCIVHVMYNPDSDDRPWIGFIGDEGVDITSFSPDDFLSIVPSYYPDPKDIK